MATPTAISSATDVIGRASSRLLVIAETLHAVNCRYAASNTRG